MEQMYILFILKKSAAYKATQQILSSPKLYKNLYVFWINVWNHEMIKSFPGLKLNFLVWGIRRLGKNATHLFEALNIHEVLTRVNPPRRARHVHRGQYVHKELVFKVSIVSTIIITSKLSYKIFLWRDLKIFRTLCTAKKLFKTMTGP